MLTCQDIIFSPGRSAVIVIANLLCFFKDIKDAAAAIESTAKVGALIVAGWWTWHAYVRKRIRFPSGKVEHVISDWEDSGIRFLRVTLRITNTGNVLIPIGEGCTWIQQVTPVPHAISDAVAKGKDPVQKGTTEFGWTMIGERKLNPAGDFQVEPGEAQEFYFDFTFDGDASRVLVYSYLENSVEGRLLWKPKKIGWQLSTVYEIT